MTKTLRPWLVVCGLCALLAPAHAQGRHPRYVRARTDLRAALLTLRVHDEPNVMRQVHEADRELDAAIQEIDRAAVIDRKDIVDNPPLDARLDRPGRFRKALQLMAGARRDISDEEDNPRANAWRDAAFRHLDRAIQEIRRAGRELHIDHLEGY